MNGAIDPIYVLARRVLLDTIEALGDQRQALILVVGDLARVTPRRGSASGR